MAQSCFIKLDTDRIIGKRDPMIFGHIVEHFHRQVYGGVFEPGSPLSDSRGFRNDVIEALRRIRVPVIRWPGGCFASDYHWKCGVGERTPMLDKAWRVEEPNTFGTDEFVEFCRAVGAEPFICTNAGTGTPEEMSDWVEYCNRDIGRWAKLRRENGNQEPHGVKYWGIGNENYGFSEMGSKTEDEWARFVTESAKMMKRADSSIRLSAAGMAGDTAKPDLDWNLKLLKAAGRYLDYISIHSYWAWGNASYEECIARSGDADKSISKLEHILGALGLLGQVRISYDEWNLRHWHLGDYLGADPDIGARALNEANSTYTMADVVFSARFLNICLRHCRSMGMANLSPMINTRGALFTHKEGLVLRSTYHLFDLYVNHTSPEVMDAFVSSPTFDVQDEQKKTVEVPYLDAVATRDEERRRLDLMLVSTHMQESMECEIDLGGLAVEPAATLRRVHGESKDSFNDIDHPEDVRMVAEEISVPPGRFSIILPPHSASVLSLRLAGYTAG